ncbi:MAG: hypothetical protein V5A62_03295 [Haloarculaceae archaeon]
MNDALLRWPLGAGIALTVTALGWRFLAADPYLLSALGVAWFAGVTTYVTVTLQQSLSIPLPAGRSPRR